MLRLFIAISISLLLISCSGTSGSSGGEPAPVHTVEWSFEREAAAGLDTIKGTISVFSDGIKYNTDDVELSLLRPDENATNQSVDLTLNTLGQHTFSITPSQTGEHALTLKHNKKPFYATPVVLDEVATDWGQPVMVDGLVNTKGTDSNAHITHDGQWLFIQYSPMSASSQLVANAGKTNDLTNRTADVSYYPVLWLDLVRPSFPKGRLPDVPTTENGVAYSTLTQDSTLFADDSFRPPTAFYGFKRNDDDSYYNPFFIQINDQKDGSVNSQGLSVSLKSDGTPLTTFSLIDPSTVPATTELGDDMHDIYAAGITLGHNSALLNYKRDDTPAIVKYGTELAQPAFSGDTAMRNNNPFIYLKNDATDSIWVDDYGDMLHPNTNLNAATNGDISIYKANNGGYDTAQPLSTTINTTTNTQSQPFFNGTHLYYREAIGGEDYGTLKQSAAADSARSDYDHNSFWTTPTMLLGVDTNTSATRKIGEIITLGDPTEATIEGEKVLFFTYGKIRGEVDGDLDIDIQVGYVKRNSAP